MSAPRYVPEVQLTSDTGTGSAVTSLNITATPRDLFPGSKIILHDGIGTNVTTFTTGLTNAGATAVTIVPTDFSAHDFLAATPTEVFGFASPLLPPLAFWFRGVTFGENVGPVTAQPGYETTLAGVFQTVTIQGIDQPAITSGDLPRPLDTGQFKGVDTLGGRDIIVEVAIGAQAALDLDNFRAIIAHAMAPLQPASTTEEPLFFTTPGGLATYACNVRPIAYTFKVDLNAVQAFGLIATLRFHATDPRLYSSPTLLLDLISTGTSVAGDAPNNGNIETRPIFTVTAATGTPAPVTIRNNSLPGGPALIFTEPMAVGDQIIVDTDFHTAWYVPAIGSPFDALYQLDAASQWWNTPNGSVNQIQFDSVGGDSELTLEYAYGYASV